ncbi:unnamed protein product [Meloidogyne enterolobii]|uniref:Uncharacterized protein n=1 Tax=Meloidogyne enterolobii TaxID=390850 RepID=A0ACB0Z6E8_MELEN
MGSDKEECVSRQAEIFTILKNFLEKILKEGELEVSVKQPEDLQLWERSSLNISNKKDDVISQIASFSNIGIIFLNFILKKFVGDINDLGYNRTNLILDTLPQR